MTTPASMSELSTTAASNNPPGSDAPSTIDDQIRALAAIVRQNVTKGSDIASASAITIPASGNYFVVTGTTGITSITDTNSWYGREVALKFSGALTITHSANLILPGGANISTAANDVGRFVSESSGVWRCSAYERYRNPDITAAKVNDFRLTLTSGTPVTTSDVTAAGTVYACPYKGNAIALYDGTNWNIRTSAEFSLALSGLTSGKPYDVFCYDNSGTPTLEFLVWTNDTTRATALAYQDGVLVKSGAATRRYLGTFYTTGTTTTEDSVANRYLWNYYHRVNRKLSAKESTSQWSYTTATWRQARASSANQVNFVIGVSEDQVIAHVLADAVNSDATGAFASAGIGLDATNALSTDQFNAGAALENNREKNLNAAYRGYPGSGKHYLAWLEYSQATGTTTWYGNGGGVRQTGIFGEVLA